MRLPRAKVTPSRVWPAAKAVAREPFAMDAQRTGSFQVWVAERAEGGMERSLSIWRLLSCISLGMSGGLATY